MRLLALLLLSLCCLPTATLQAAEPDPRLFELRTYQIVPGKMVQALAYFRTTKQAFLENHGVSVLGFWTPEDTADERVFCLLAYPNAESRHSIWEALFEDEEWLKIVREIEEKGSPVNDTQSVLLTTTGYSPELNFSSEAKARQFELRIYTTLPGRLPNLDARFRDHTMKLFEKHGMTNLIYFHPAIEEGGPENTLIYFLSHQNDAARQASFDAFRRDPAWIEARTASEESGPIVAPDGVVSVPLRPTDFSPLR